MALSNAAFLVGRWAAALLMCALFWWLASTRLTISPWLVAAVPAAILGWVLLFRERNGNALALVLLIVGSIVSTVMGELSFSRARLEAARQRQVKDQRESLLNAIIEEEIRRQSNQADKAPNSGDEVVELKSTAPSERAIGWPLAAQVAFSRFSENWHEWLLSFGLSFFSAFQAARMTLARFGRQSEKNAD